MMKRLIGCFICLLFLLPASALAHTGLESSSPQDMETVTSPLKEIILTFNTNIEQLSTFTLVNKQGQEIKADALTVEDMVMKGSWQEPLPNDDYTVNWKIVGEDGHIIERSFTFTVNMPEQVEETPSPTPSEPAEESQTEEPPVQAAPAAAPSNNKNMFIWIGAGVFVIVVIGILGLTMRKRK